MAGIAEQLRQAVLQAAIQGKLTEQLPKDGDARELLADIQAEKAKLIAEKKIKKEKPLEPISDDEIPFNIPDNWVLVKLAEIAFVTKLAGFEYTKEIAPNLAKSGIPLFKGKNIQNGHTVYKFESYIPKEVSKSLPRSQLTKPCLLTPYVGTIGNISIFDAHIPAHLGSNVGKIEPFNNENENVNLNYLLYYMLSPFGIQQLGKHKKKNAQESTSIDAIRDCFVYLPPLAEQHRIVARVDELMAKIDELEKVENELNALHKAFPGDMKAALLQAAMQGKLTEQLPEDGNVDALLLAIKEERNGLIAKKEIKKDVLENLTDTPFDVPESWRWVKLNNIVIKNIKRGKSPTYAPNSHILVFAQKCNTKAGYINMDLALFLDEDKAKKYPNSEYMQDADTIINSTGNGTLGRVGFYKESDNPRHFPVVPDSHVTVVRTSSKLNKKYVMYCLKYYQPYFEKKCTGSTNQTELGVDIVKNLPFPVPPIKEQQRIVEKLDKLLPLCDSLEEKL